MRRARNEELVLPVLVASVRAARWASRGERMNMLDLVLMLVVRYDMFGYRQADIGRGLGLNVRTVNERLKRLRRLGLVSYGRGKSIDLTEEGKKMIRGYAQLYGESYRLLFGRE